MARLTIVGALAILGSSLTYGTPAPREESPAAAAVPAPCPSCDARHARLRDAAAARAARKDSQEAPK